MDKETGKLAAETDNKLPSSDLIGDIRRLIETARHNVAVTVNVGLTILYWQIGDRIRQDILKEKRAEYGKEIVATLSQELTKEYGNGFSYSALTRMVRFAEAFPDTQIVAILSRQLSWLHFKEILPFKKSLQRDFYAEMCRLERWSVRTLRKKIDGMLYDRTTKTQTAGAEASQSNCTGAETAGGKICVVQVILLRQLNTLKAESRKIRWMPHIKYGAGLSNPA